MLQKVIRRISFVKSRVSSRFRTLGSACVTLLVRTKKRQWREVAHGGPPPWDKRNEFIAGFIPAGSSVLDVGCGAQTLKKHLKPGCRYQPCDVIKSSPDVIYCDFNAGIYPDIKERFDYVVCSGVLEYIRQPQKFLERVHPWGRVVILSYNPLAPGASKIERLGNGLGWVNHFTREELESLFYRIGLSWTILGSDIEKLGYVLFLLEKKGSKITQSDAKE